MRNIKKREINVLLSPQQHSLIAKLKETGVNMSSLSRLAIRKFGATDLEERPDDGAKTKRVVIYLEAEDIESLETISTRKGISKSDALRRLLSTYLTVNQAALNQLF
jgi:hypothetical protein